MLWLTGVLGLIGASAASVFMFPTENTDEEETRDPGQSTSDQGDLFDFVGDRSASTEESASLLAGLVTAAGGGTADMHASHGLARSDADELIFREDSPLDLRPFETADNDPSSDIDVSPARDASFPDVDDAPDALAELTELHDESETPDSAPPLGDWITQGKTGEIVEYQAEKEQLMLVWDDIAAPLSEPTVDVADDPHDDEVKHILMNGQSVAEIYGAPDLHTGDVAIIPLSSALIAGLEPA